MGLSKKGKQNNMLFYVVIGVVVAYALNLGGLQQLIPIGGGSTPAPSDGSGDSIAGSSGLFATCPTTGSTSLKIDVKNELNTTTVESFDVTGYLYDSSGAMVATISDTTSPTASSINCGDRYVFKVVASDSDGGDNSKVQGLYYGDATVNSDGTVSFAATRAAQDIALKLKKHGILQFKVYDNDAAGWMCNTDDSCSDFELTGQDFESTVNNTAKAIGSTDTLDVTASIKSTSSAKDFSDYYVLVAIDAGTDALTVWNTPTVKWNGAVLPKATLTTEETKALAAYEHVYRIDAPFMTPDVYDTHELQIVMVPQSGQNPSTDIVVNLYAAGNYLSVDGKTVKTGAFRDNSAYSAVYTLQNFDLDIS